MTRIHIPFLLLWLALVAIPAYSLAVDKEPATSAEDSAKSWPKSVDEAVTKIVGGLSEHDRRRVVSTEKEDLILFHHGWGTGIRNSFGLWSGNLELLRSCGSQSMHPDEASMVIIEAVWKKLRAEADPTFLIHLEKMRSTAKAILVPSPNYHWARIEKAVADMNAAVAAFRTQNKDDRFAPLKVEIAGAVTPDWPVVYENPNSKPVSIHDLLACFAMSHGFEIIYDYPVARIYREEK